MIEPLFHLNYIIRNLYTVQYSHGCLGILTLLCLLYFIIDVLMGVFSQKIKFNNQQRKSTLDCYSRLFLEPVS